MLREWIISDILLKKQTKVLHLRATPFISHIYGMN